MGAINISQSLTTSPAPASRLRDFAFTAVVYGCSAALLGIFGWILFDLIYHGVGKLSWSFLTDAPQSSGRRGGIAPILVSTLWILGIAIAAALPVAIGVAVWLAEFAHQRSRFLQPIRVTLDVMAGVPSIVFGLFGNAFFCVFLGMGFSILSGGLTLACMMLPILTRATEAGLTEVPNTWRAGAAALGMSRASMLWHVLLPAAAPAIIAGLLLGIGRAVAETAALIFTSGYVDRMPDSMMDSGRSLAVHIYDLSMNVTGGDQAAYASALVLIGLICAIGLIAVWLGNHFLARRIQTA